MSESHAAERVVRTWGLPQNIELSLLVGYYWSEGIYPISWRARRSGRVVQRKTPWTAVYSLLKFEKMDVMLSE